MNDHRRGWVVAAVLASAWVMPSHAAGDAALLKDLTSVIALLGLPCDQVIDAKRLTDSDHIATCRNGSRYRVFLNAEGKVVAQKQ